MIDDRMAFLILDANVLIDIVKCDKTILMLISRHVGQIIIPTTILEEVKGLTEDECRVLGLTLIEPSLDLLSKAVQMPRPLSLEDWTCVLLAEKYRYVCVSNDKALRKQCNQLQLTVKWELELLCNLTEAGGILPTQCGNIIRIIQNNNPFFITNKIVAEAFNRLGLKCDSLQDF